MKTRSSWAAAGMASALALLTIWKPPLARATEGPAKSPALCGPRDTPEKGIQGDRNAGTVNCGLTLLSDVAAGGSVQGSGHCAYVRLHKGMYTGSVIRAYNLGDPMNPVQTDETPALGGSESMRAMTTDSRAILVSGRGVYDISNCEKIVFKGQIDWPSTAAAMGLYMLATSSHEIAISHDAKRVYSGLGFAIAHIEDLDHPQTWRVDDWQCEMNRQSDYALWIPFACKLGYRQYSHSSDDNLQGTRWYGANQDGDGFSQGEPPTARIVDISDPAHIKILDKLPNFPGHSMNWWRAPDGREFVIGANESLGRGGDSCQNYPRPTRLGNSMEAHVAEVTGDKFKPASLVTLAINRPENCKAAQASGGTARITEHSVYNKNGVAFAMVEFGTAGLRIFDLRDGYAPREVAYFNDGAGQVHSGLFYYDDAKGIVVASGSSAMHVLELEPQVIQALGLPYPTDPGYPFTKIASK